MVSAHCGGVRICKNRDTCFVCDALPYPTLMFQGLISLRISLAGLVVLGGHTKVENPWVNWDDPWKGNTQASAYGATNAMVKLIFSYAGYQNAFGLVNEIKVCTLKNSTI